MDQLINTIKERIINKQFNNKAELQNVIATLKNDERFKDKVTPQFEQEMLDTFDSIYGHNESIKAGVNVNYEIVLSNLESKIKNKEFKTKAELSEYLSKLRSEGIPNDILTVEKITELLNLYDSVNQTLDDSINLENYKSVTLEKKNVVVATEKDVILKTDKSNSETPEEFKSAQNELTAIAGEGLANADEAFDYMRKTKEELQLMPVSEALNKDNIDVEMLNKIRFFVTNKDIDYKDYQIDVERGVFYNAENDDVLEVRENEKTGQYEIFRGGEKMYSNEQTEEPKTNENDNELELDKDEEKLTDEKNKLYTRKLVPPKENGLDNSAFIQGGLLFTICLVISILFAVILFIYQ